MIAGKSPVGKACTRALVDLIRYCSIRRARRRAESSPVLDGGAERSGTLSDLESCSSRPIEASVFVNCGFGWGTPGLKVHVLFGRRLSMEIFARVRCTRSHTSLDGSRD